MPTVLSFTDAELRDISFALDLALDELAPYGMSESIQRLRALARRFDALPPVPDSTIQP